MESGSTTPSFDTLVRLVRLCGLELEVALVQGEESDRAQYLRLRSLTPGERLERAQRVAARLRQLRGAGCGKTA